MIEDWWAEAAATVRGAREPVGVDELHRMIEGADSETLVVTKANDATPIGLLVFRLPADGWLEFRFLALADGHRGWGYGSEAVRLIEESGRARRFAAEVRAGNGLGLYFWLRMGYRPASREEVRWPAKEAADIIAMVREQKE
ncbi:MAG TPA: GNAT family N-acetyltransferase [Dehalococcoidia bacterium]